MDAFSDLLGIQRTAALLPLRMFCGLLFTGLVAACGGGGGAVSTPTSMPLEAAALTQSSRLTSEPVAVVRAAGYYIDAQLGDDRNPGTLTLPWQTLSRASAVSLKDGEGLFLRCGRVWRESLNLGAKQLVDGSKVAGYGTECMTQKASINGADDFSGGWTLTNGVWSRSVPAGTPKITQLFVDGQPLRTAQWPNPSAGALRMAVIDKAAGTKTLTMRSSDAATLQANDVVGATIQLRTQAWMVETRRVSAVNGQSLMLDNATNWDLLTGQGFVLQDKRWMLDSPGEYFHDEVAQRLHVIPPAARNLVDFNLTLVEGSVRDYALIIGQRSGVSIQQLSLTGARNTGLLIHDAPGALVSGIDASANLLVGIQLRYGLPDIATATAATIADSTVSNNGQYGIEAAGMSRPVIVRNTLNATGMGWHRLSNTVAAIAAGPGARVEDNEINGAGYAGIMFSSQGGSVVTRNNITDPCSRLSDCAGIYSWTGRAQRQPGQSSTVQANRVSGSGVATEGMAPNASDIVAGIYIDDFSDGVTVADNQLMNSSVGVFVHNASRVTVKNNKIWLAKRAGLWASMDQTDADAMTDNLFEGNQIVPVVQALAVAGSLPAFTVAPAVWFAHASSGSTALTTGRNTFKNNIYVQLQGSVAAHAWVSGAGGAGYVSAAEWQRLNANESYPLRPVNYATLLPVLGPEQVADSNFDSGLAQWSTWVSPAGQGFSAQAQFMRAGCVGGCINFVSGNPGDLMASKAFRLKPGVPHVYRWSAVMPASAGATVGLPYISRDGTPWDSMADAQGFSTFVSRAAAAGERLNYEAYFMPKSSDLAHVNLQLETAGVNVGIDAVSVREVTGYTVAALGEWVKVVSAPAGASKLVGCAELDWSPNCSAVGLDGLAIALPTTLPAGSDQLFLRANSLFRRW